jgi:hypothetical protein
MTYRKIVVLKRLKSTNKFIFKVEKTKTMASNHAHYLIYFFFLNSYVVCKSELLIWPVQILIGTTVSSECTL